MSENTFKEPIKISFPSKIEGNVFKTLNGEKEVSTRSYSRYISNIKDLSKEELVHVIETYNDFQLKAESLRMYLNNIL